MRKNRHARPDRLGRRRMLDAHGGRLWHEVSVVRRRRVQRGLVDHRNHNQVVLCVEPDLLRRAIDLRQPRSACVAIELSTAPCAALYNIVQYTIYIYVRAAQGAGAVRGARGAARGALSFVVSQTVTACLTGKEDSIHGQGRMD